MRVDGWEARLWPTIDAARSAPYVLGEHDCFRLTCRVVEALTGVDRWPEFAGRYRTRREAMVLLAEHGSSFENAFDWFFGVLRVPARMARRGDIVALRTEDGEKHLGVSIGTKALFLAPVGLRDFPIERCLCAWRIGD